MSSVNAPAFAVTSGRGCQWEGVSVGRLWGPT